MSESWSERKSDAVFEGASPNRRIAVVDDDPEIRKALGRLLRGRGFEVVPFASGEEFLGSIRSLSFDCILLDLEMPGVGGMEIQEKVRESGLPLPVVFLTGHGDIPTTVRAVKAGAIQFLTKPVERSELFAALRLAVIESDRNRARDAEVSELRSRFEKLTPRESEVLRHVIAGKLNKQIAYDLGIREQTVKIHRMHVTEKTGLPSVAELVRAATALGIKPASPTSG